MPDSISSVRAQRTQRGTVREPINRAALLKRSELSFNLYLNKRDSTLFIGL